MTGIDVLVNDRPQQVPEGATVADVIEMIGCGWRGVAVALNTELVPRGLWVATTLASGDQLEVLHAVQGGC